MSTTTTEHQPLVTVIINDGLHQTQQHNLTPSEASQLLSSSAPGYDTWRRPWFDNAPLLRVYHRETAATEPHLGWSRDLEGEYCFGGVVMVAAESHEIAQ